MARYFCPLLSQCGDNVGFGTHAAPEPFNSLVALRHNTGYLQVSGSGAGDFGTVRIRKKLS
jgi:hypothetical protein